MNPEAIVRIDPCDFRNRPCPNITQTIRGDGTEFAISCDFICPSHSWWQQTTVFHHPSPPFARVFVVEHGPIDLEIDTRKHLLDAEHIYLLPPEHPFQATYHKGARIKGFHVYLSDGFGFPLGNSLTGVPEIGDTRVFEAVIAAIESGEPAVWQAAVFQVLVMFHRPLFPELERRAQLTPGQKKILEIVSGTPPGELRIGDLADRLHISRAALSKSFERQFRIPLKRYIQDHAMRQAKKRLTTTDMTVAEIAFDLGYREPAYFQRVFKREVGLTPFAYRQEHGLATARSSPDNGLTS